MTKATDEFFSAWSISESTARREAIGNAVSSTVLYADPRTPTPLSNLEALDQYVAMFVQSAPGATAKVIKSDETLGTQRATVAFEMADGIVQLGQYFITFDDDGKINQMTGFVGTGAPDIEA